MSSTTPMWTLAPARMRGAPRRAGEPTARQIEVLDLLAAGNSTEEIARLLHVERSTTHSHLAHLAREWQVEGWFALIGEGFARGFLVPVRCAPVRLPAKLATPLTRLPRGASIKEVALEMGVTCRTIHNHLAAAARMLRARNAFHAVAVWAARSSTSDELWGQAVLDVREVAMIERTAAGEDPQAIARETGMPDHVVLGRLAKLRAEAGVRENVALVAWAYRAGHLLPARREPVTVPMLVRPVVERVAAGDPVPQIALALNLAESVVWRALAEAHRVLGVASRLELVVAAFETGLLEPDPA